MKKIVIITLLSIFLLSGCNKNENIWKTVEDAMPDSFGTYEWVSPDGVHYWVVHHYNTYGITPRYDNDGNLVIESGK